jgi:glycosyltransferase involved in cell wall biosynthesis
MPRISVILPVYNGVKYLREAVDSILNQTYSDFEFIIIDDGSSDETPQILDSYNDKRIVRKTNPANMGLVASLNLGIEMAQGEFIAIMNADDISLPYRLQAQYDYMNSKPDVGFLGTNMCFIDAEGQVYRESLYDKSDILDGAYFHWRMLWENHLAHPTMMIRSAELKNASLSYCAELYVVEDYDLWLRAARVSKLAAHPQVCLKYRVHSESKSAKFRIKRGLLKRQLQLRELALYAGMEIPPRVAQAIHPHPLEKAAIDLSDVRGAIEVVRRAMEGFLDWQKASDADSLRIRSDAYRNIRRRVVAAHVESRWKAMLLLLNAAKLHPASLFSVHTAKDLLRIVLKRGQR